VYGKKVRKLESAEYLALNKPALELNIGAANRFISHAIPDLSKDQKAALKEVRQDPSQSHRFSMHSANRTPEQGEGV